MFYEGTTPINVTNIDTAFISNEPTIQRTLSLMGDSLIDLPLTPTTLNSIEQTFMELQQQPISTMANTTYTTDSFVQNPPTTTVESFSNKSAPFIKSEPMFDETSSYSSEQDGTSDFFVVPNIDPVTYLVANSRRPTGPRRKRNLDELSTDDLEKLGQRRERNRMAAAKCRQKRDNHTMRLVHETEQLEVEQAGLETEIQSLQRQKEELEAILRGHMSNCTLVGNTSSNNLVNGSQPLPVTAYNHPSMATQQPSFNNCHNHVAMPPMTTAYTASVQPVVHAASATSTTSVNHMNNFNNFADVSNATGNFFQYENTKPAFDQNFGINVPITCSAQLRRYSLERSLSNGLVSPKLMC